MAACSCRFQNCCAPGCNFRNDGDCTAPVYTIGENASLGALYADDDVVVQLNGSEVFRDYGTGAGRVAISFPALPGDWVTMRFYDTVGYGKAHGEIWLGATSLPAVKVFDGLNGGRSTTNLGTAWRIYWGALRLWWTDRAAA